MVEPDVIAVQPDVFSVDVDEMLRLQGVQLVHGVINATQGVGAVTDGFQAGKMLKEKKTNISIMDRSISPRRHWTASPPGPPEAR